MLVGVVLVMIMVVILTGLLCVEDDGAGDAV